MIDGSKLYVRETIKEITTIQAKTVTAVKGKFVPLTSLVDGKWVDTGVNLDNVLEYEGLLDIGDSE